MPQAEFNFYRMRVWPAYRIKPSPRPVAGSHRFRFLLPEYQERGNCSPAPRRTSAIFPPTVEGKRKRVGRVREGRGKTFGGLIWFSPPLLHCIQLNSFSNSPQYPSGRPNPQEIKGPRDKTTPATQEFASIFPPDAALKSGYNRSDPEGATMDWRFSREFVAAH
jgi:hypothetical protein